MGSVLLMGERPRQDEIALPENQGREKPDKVESYQVVDRHHKIDEEHISIMSEEHS